MTHAKIAKCFILGGITLIITAFMNIVNLVNNYDTYVNSNSSHVISAFDG